MTNGVVEQSERCAVKVLQEIRGMCACWCAENNRKLVIVVCPLIWLHISTVSSLSSSSGCDTQLMETVKIIWLLTSVILIYY